MADERGHDSYSDRTDRERPQRAQRTQNEKSANSTHSSYEEAIRRSNERLNSSQRRMRRLNEPQQDAYNSTSTAYAPRRQQTIETGRTYQRERRTVRLGGANQHGEQPDGYTQQQQRSGYAQQRQQARTAQQTPASAQQQRAGGLPMGVPNNLPNPFSRQQQGGNLREQQFQDRSRTSGGYQSRRPSFPSMGLPSFNMPMQGSGTGFNGVVVRAVICVVLLIVVIFSFTRLGPAGAALSEAESNMATRQEALDNQNAANESLQAQLDQMQPTIDKYNELKASQS